MASLMVGLAAGILCTISFLPQVIKILKTKQARDLSLTTFCVLSLGLFLWLIYGILIKALPIILANIGGLILSLAIVVMTIRYK